MDEQRPLTYRDAGVDIDAGHDLVDRIRPAVEATRRPEVLGGIGGFGGMMALPAGYRQPVLVAGTDGVGTKLRLAIETGRHEGVGIDLVAMCANDVLVQGAEPLLFLDYYATAELDVETAAAVIRGIAAGCEAAGAALLGGETAEMPGMYAAGDYDLAGFCVGIAERERIIDGTAVEPGDALIALPASGPHANGYSLIRKILERHPAERERELDGEPLLDHLLRPTRIYAGAARTLLDAVPVRALCHVTGGGLVENLPRVLPDGCGADLAPWGHGAIFDWIRETGGVEPGEMLRTFNCGVGLVACVPAEDAERALSALADSGEPAWRLGCVIETAPDQPRLYIDGEPA